MSTRNLLIAAGLAWLAVAGLLIWQMMIAELHPRWLVLVMSRDCRVALFLGGVSSLFALVGAIRGRQRMLHVGAAVAVASGLLAVAYCEVVVAYPYYFWIIDDVRGATPEFIAMIRTDGLTVLLAGLTGAMIAFGVQLYRSRRVAGALPEAPE